MKKSVKNKGLFFSFVVSFVGLIAFAKASSGEDYNGVSDSLTPCAISIFKDNNGRIVQARVDHLRELFVLYEKPTSYGYSVLIGSISTGNLIYNVTVYMNGDQVSRYELDTTYPRSGHLFYAKSCFDLK